MSLQGAITAMRYDTPLCKIKNRPSGNRIMRKFNKLRNVIQEKR